MTYNGICFVTWTLCQGFRVDQLSPSSSTMLLPLATSCDGNRIISYPGASHADHTLQDVRSEYGTRRCNEVLLDTVLPLKAFGIGCQISQSQGRRLSQESSPFTLMFLAGFSFAPRLLNVVMMCFLLGTSYSCVLRRVEYVANTVCIFNSLNPQVQRTKWRKNSGKSGSRNPLRPDAFSSCSLYFISLMHDIFNTFPCSTETAKAECAGANWPGGAPQLALH